MKKIIWGGMLIVMSLVVTSCSSNGKINETATPSSNVNDVTKSTETGTTGDNVSAVEKVSENPFNIINYKPQTDFNINIETSELEIQEGKITPVNLYNTGNPGGMIITEKGKELTFNVNNKLTDVTGINTTTNIHWHGLKVTNDQDGAFVEIKKGESYKYNFTLDQTGSNWFHPHQRPILEQLNSGLYAPFIIKDEVDSKYAGDYVLTLDDWALSPDGIIDSKYSTGTMEVLGNVETVNGKTGKGIYPISLKKGEIVKLRFINASTAQPHIMSLKDHEFRVTHLDGVKLLEPYNAKEITINPGERIDVELKGIKEDGTYNINNNRNFGISIPVIYDGIGEDMQSPFVPDAPKAFAGIENKPVDFELVLNSKMEAGSEHSTTSMTMDAEKTIWTINDKSFPDTENLKMKKGEVYKLRFYNKDTEMDHAMEHPIHIHGEHFQVVSVNGVAPSTETFKDTINVLPNEYVDIAVKFDNEGTWMLHCHIIDHEDNGMLTTIVVE